MVMSYDIKGIQMWCYQVIQIFKQPLKIAMGLLIGLAMTHAGTVGIMQVYIHILIFCKFIHDITV